MARFNDYFHSRTEKDGIQENQAEDALLDRSNGEPLSKEPASGDGEGEEGKAKS